MSEFNGLLIVIVMLAFGIAGQHTLNRVIKLEKRVKELEENNDAE